MMKKNLTLPAIALAAVMAIGGGAAVAKGNAGGENDAVADLAKARISLTQAIAAAEQHAGGRATGAELETENGKTEFEVEVVAANNTVHDVTVDAQTGKVTKSELDKADSDKEDEGNEGAEAAD